MLCSVSTQGLVFLSFLLGLQPAKLVHSASISVSRADTDDQYDDEYPNNHAEEDGCGHLSDGKMEHTRCAECTCDRGILTCVGLAVTECPNLPHTSPLSVLDFLHMRGSRISTLLKLVIEVERLAYQSYIEMHNDMRLMVRNIDSDDAMKDDIDRRIERRHTQGLDQKNSTVLVVLTSNKQMVGLHLKRILSTHASRSSNLPKSVQKAAGIRFSFSSYFHYTHAYFVHCLAIIFLLFQIICMSYMLYMYLFCSTR